MGLILTKRRLTVAGYFLAASVMSCVFTAQAQPQGDDHDPVVVPATSSFNGEAFAYDITLREDMGRYRVFDLNYPSPVESPHPANNRVPAELFLPSGIHDQTGFPAVVAMHILNGDFALSRTICARLASEGVVAMFFKQPYYGARGGDVGTRIFTTDTDIFPRALEQGVADGRRAVDILQSMPYVDAGLIGVTGVSLGALSAVNLCGREPRIHKAFLMLVGSNIRRVIEESRQMRNLRAILGELSDAERERFWDAIANFEPLRWRDALARLAAQDGLRMVLAENDQVLPAAGGRDLARAASAPDGVILLKGMDHYTALAGLPRILNQLADFFRADTPETWHPAPAPDALTPIQKVGALLSDITRLLSANTHPEKMHLVGFEAAVERGGKDYHARVHYACDGRGRFKIQGTFPGIDEAGFGLKPTPWITGAGKRLFVGRNDFSEERRLEDFVRPQSLIRYRMFLGMLTGAGLAPGTLQPYMTLNEARGSERERVLEMELRHRSLRITVRMGFARHDGTPRWLTWNDAQGGGRIDISHWGINVAANEEVFAPPDELPRTDVRQDDLLQMIAALFDYALETLE